MEDEREVVALAIYRHFIDQQKEPIQLHVIPNSYAIADIALAALKTHWTRIVLAGHIQKAILDEASVWEVEFEEGTSDAVGVSDAAVVAANKVMSFLESGP